MSPFPLRLPAVWLPDDRRRQSRGERDQAERPIAPSMGEIIEQTRHLEDTRLLHRVAAGEHDALGELYDRFSRPLYTVALRVLNDPREAEDIVHDVFVTVWEKASEFQETRGSAFAWAVTLTRNRAIDRVRQRRRRHELLAESAPEDLGQPASAGADHDSATDLWHKEKALTVRNAVSTLPPEQQRALELAFFSGLTQQEIAARLQQPLGTVKARIRRALFKLRDILSAQL